jgi:hypothetical protein
MTILRNAIATGTAVLMTTAFACAGFADETKQLDLVAAAPGSGKSVAVTLDPSKLPENATTRPAPSLSAPSAQNPSFAPMALNSLTNPPAQIATARVFDIRGTPVGAVQKVELDANGKPLQVQIALMGSNRVVAMTPDSLSYDITNNAVTAALDKEQMAALPALSPPTPRG